MNITLPVISFNWVDFVLVIILLYFFLHGWQHGVWGLIPIRKLQHIDSLLGGIFNLIAGLILCAFGLFFILMLPVDINLKNSILNSKFGSKIVSFSELYASPIKSTFDTATSKALQFLTVKPKSKDFVDLDVNISQENLKVDENLERQMFNLINNERIKNGKVPLYSDESLSKVARERSREILIQKYFSHFDKDGNEISAKLNDAKIVYIAVGENLAFAKDIDSAFSGLMQSVMHRNNILDSSFTNIGIGVVSAGPYGIMFTQVFISR